MHLDFAELAHANPECRNLSMNRLLRTAILGSLVLSVAACGRGGDRPKADIAASKVTTIGVNSYLWRASLDTLSFMPLLQTDSNGGVIVTDWYVNPNVRPSG
jgi:predicted small lipoprotein YifL